MAHETSNPFGWSPGDPITGAQITDIDRKTNESIDKLGDVVSGVIEFESGGKVQVDPGGQFVMNGSDGYIQSGSHLRITNSTVTANSGTSITVAGTFEFSTTSTISVIGDLTFGFSRWPKFSARSQSKRGAPILVGTSRFDAAKGDAFYSQNQYTATNVHGVMMGSSDEADHVSQLAIPGIDSMFGNTLDSVGVRRIVGQGEGSGTMHLPVYRVVQYSNSTRTLLSSSVTDPLTAWDFGTAGSVSISLTSPATVAGNVRYVLEIDHPWNADEPADMLVYEVFANYTVTQIQP